MPPPARGAAPDPESALTTPGPAAAVDPVPVTATTVQVTDATGRVVGTGTAGVAIIPNQYVMPGHITFTTSANTLTYQTWYDPAQMVTYTYGGGYTVRVETDEQRRWHDDCRRDLRDNDWTAPFRRAGDQPAVDVRYSERQERERQENLERARRLREETQRREEIAQQARRRARDLLLSRLDDEQRASYEEHGHFDLVGSAGTHFRIRGGVTGNICVYRTDGTEHARVCAHPQGVPEADVHLAQLLHLTTDERSLIAVANLMEGTRVTYGRDGRMVEPITASPDPVAEWRPVRAEIDRIQTAVAAAQAAPPPLIAATRRLMGFPS